MRFAGDSADSPDRPLICGNLERVFLSRDFARTRRVNDIAQ
jgi:hypothetical protein